MSDAGGDFERFFRDEYPTIVRTLIPIVGDVRESESIAQEAFVKAMTRWSTVGRHDRPGAWVRRVAIRDAVRFVKRTPRPDADMERLVQPTQAPDDHEALYAELQNLSPQQRAAVALRHLAGWPTNEIAEALGCAEATVRVHLHRGLAVLADRLGPIEPEVCDDHR